MANLTTVVRPYAKAILQLAKEDNSYQQWTELLGFLANLAADPVGEKLLANRAVSTKEKADFICSLAPNVLTVEAQNLVRLLAVNKRLLILPELFRLYEEMRKAELGLITINLSLAQQSEIMTEDLAANVTVIKEFDPTLLGGGVAKIGNRVIDASVMGRLIAMRDQLRQ